MREIAKEAGEHMEQRHEVSIERHVEHARVLLVKRSDDSLRNRNRIKTWNEELVPPALRKAHGREESSTSMPWDYERGANTRCIVDMIELVAQRIIQRDESGLRCVIVSCKDIRLCMLSRFQR